MIDDFLYIDGGKVSQAGFTEPRESNPSESCLLLEVGRCYRESASDMLTQGAQS